MRCLRMLRPLLVGAENHGLIKLVFDCQAVLQGAFGVSARLMPIGRAQHRDKALLVDELVGVCQ